MPLKVGDLAPDFTLSDSTRKLRSLREFRGKKTVIIFYPAAFTGMCTKELCTFRDSLAAFNALDASVIAISVDPMAANRVFAEQNQLSFPVLSDFTRHVSALYAGLHMDFGAPGYTVAKRSVFVLDESGVVTYAWISENPGAEPNYDEVRAAVSSTEASTKNSHQH